VPAEFVRGAVPPAFRPMARVTQTAHVVFEALDCGRVAVPDAVVPDVGLLWVSVAVEPVNATWGGASSYTLGLLATDARVAQALRAPGLPASQTTLRREQSTDLSGLTLETWTFAAEAVYRLRWAQPADADQPSRDVHRPFWSGAGPFDRIDALESSAFSAPVGLSGGLVELEGTSAVHAAMRIDRAAFDAQLLAASRWEVPVRPVRFEVTP
jgi:hypothetical protein